MAVGFGRIKEYLEKVGSGAAFAPHGKFWEITYAQFLSQNVPGVDCHGQAIPIIDPNDLNASAFFKILQDTAGFCGNPQMPFGGKKLTNPTYQITLSDGTVVTGAQIIEDIKDWLAAGAPDDAPVA